jgi:anti-sigma factor RsiW
MNDALKIGAHLDDAMLWQWRDGELNEQKLLVLQHHLENCASCQQRAVEMERLISIARKIHHAVQPTLTAQMQLVRALEQQFIPEEILGILVKASRWLVRWLAPAVAVLAILFVLLRQETDQSDNSLASLLPETPESRLLFADTDEQLQQAMWELALSIDETQK